MFGERLRELRKKNKLTQEELGKILGVAKNTVSCWENETIKPTYDTVIELSKTFSVSTDYLFGLENLSKEEKIVRAFTEAGVFINTKDITIDDLINALKIVEMFKNKNSKK